MDYLALPECWKPIPGLEGFYEGSTHGNIRSVGTQCGRGRPRGNQLTPSPRDKAGHLRVTLSVQGKRISTDVAPLIARTFLPPAKPGEEVCHGPAGISENNPGNLYYGPRARNSQDRKRDGTWMGGENNGLAKLTWVKAAEIRQRFDAGERMSGLAAEFGVSPAAIRQVIRGKTWAAMAPPGQDIRPREGPGQAGEKNGNARLTWVVVREIRQRHAAGERQTDIVQDLGLPQTTVSNVILGKTWAEPDTQRMRV